MKKKVWVVSPLFYLMAMGMLIMACISYRYNKILFVVELTVSLLAICGVIANDLVMRKNIAVSVRSARKALSADSNAIDDFPLAVAVVAQRGDIIWGNGAFREVVAARESFMGESVLKFIYPKTLRQVISSDKGVSIAHKDKEYTVYGLQTIDSYILYFVDDSFYKQIYKKYTDTKPVVCLATFDNREEIARGSAGGEESRITAEVDAVMRNWGINQMGGFMRRLSSGHYLVVTTEAHVERAKAKRFAVLDKVREIKGTGRMSATISIGVGKGAESIADSERRARQALDMALGRGGDQVAVMQQGEAYEFFGGLSKGVEKRDKVRTRVIAAAIADHVQASDQVFIMGHKNSDLDAVGAAAGMWGVIRKGIERQAQIVIDRGQTLAGQLVQSLEEAYPNQQIFINPQDALQRATKNSLLIVVDTHSTEFVESRELLKAIPRIIIIDHHRMMVTHIKNALIFYHEPYASSASEMVAEIVQYIRASAIDAVEAQALLAGIMLDTKSFVMKTGVRTFEASAFLRRCGADTVEVKRMFSNTLEVYKEKSDLVSKAEIYQGCAITVSDRGAGDMRVASAQAADELLSILGVIASFVIYKQGDNVNISARSLGDVNVQLILEAFGGGGHFTMAGAQLRGVSLQEAKKSLQKELDIRLKDMRAEG